ncbi:hypothetical protein JHK87_031925 [Glycine soja]|nr:hypothetical protein JHK87_031925 [Glycine soja]
MTKIFCSFMEDWGIECKIFSLTLDNASSNNIMQESLKDRLLLHSNGLLCGGDYFHIRCVAHILNLIVQEGLKVVGSSIHKIRESIKYVKGSEGRMKALKDCVAKVGAINTKMGLRLDVVTRWNSSFLCLRDTSEKMCEFLHSFYEITELISGCFYPTSNLYFMQVRKIECLLIEIDYSMVLSFGCILDPRYKFGFWRFYYSKLGLDSMAIKAKLKIVKHKLYILYNDYVKLYSKKETTCNVALSQMQKLSSQYHSNLDLLQYWKENKARFPELALLACGILSIQIITMASKSAFSISSRVLNKYRTTLLPEKCASLDMY